MKLINKNVYKVMFGLDFIEPNEVKEINNKIAKDLLKHPKIEKYVDVEEVESLKKELELEKAKNKANELGISYAKNIGLDALLKKIAKFENAE